ncbi:hypothetical protein MASSI9I_10252 [Massilia sp. 9I]|nr:hypothetical protein MASSI9I_10252 [Massilia sp. 9I]
MDNVQNHGVHVGTKKSPSGETGLHLMFKGRTEGRRYYAALQELVIIEISDKGYYHPEYDLGLCAHLPAGLRRRKPCARQGADHTRFHARTPAAPRHL